MKNIIFINGTTGVGKSTVSRMLLNFVEPVAYLDGEWCWCMQPFAENPKNVNMALDNIAYLLRAYLHNDDVQNVILDWTMYHEKTIEALFQKLADESFTLHKFTLICSENELRARLVHDITAGRREASVVGESVALMPLFEKMDANKIDVGTKSDLEAAREIAEKIKQAEA